MLDNVACTGNETRLVDCANAIPNCRHYEDIGVICQGEVQSICVHTCICVCAYVCVSGAQFA